MGYLVICIAFGLLCAWLAKQKNRNPWSWFLLGAVFTLPAFIVIVFLKPIPEKVTEEPMRKCPFCAENIKLEAKKCRYCGEMLTEIDETEEFFQTLDRKELSKDWEEYALRKH